LWLGGRGSKETGVGSVTAEKKKNQGPSSAKENTGEKKVVGFGSVKTGKKKRYVGKENW